MHTPHPTVDSDTSSQSRSQRALRLFDDLIFENPETCSQCFGRIRDRTEHDVSADRLGTGNRPTETITRAGDGIVGQDDTTHDAYGAQRTYRAKTYCGVCGSPSGRADGAHICSLQQARRRADNIIRRLHRLGYYPDVQALYSAIETLKTDPDHQGQDREIFATATYLAIERGDTAPDVCGTPRVGRFELAGPSHIQPSPPAAPADD